MDKSKLKIIIISILVFIVIASGIAAFMIYNYIDEQVNRDVIYEGITIEGIQVGGLSKEEAYELINEEAKTRIESKMINIMHSAGSYELNYSYFDFKSNIDEIVDKAYNIGKEGKLLDRYYRIKELREGQIDYNLTYHYNVEKIDEFLSSIKNDFSTEAKNAIIHRKNREFIIEEEVIGTNLNMVESKNNILSALDKNGKEASLIIDEIIPQYTKEYYSNVKDPIGTTYTEFNPNKIGRTENLRVACSMIDGTLLMPGESFSTHATVSPINAENGYKPAPIFINGKVEDGMGGGVCQVATTLYSAVLKAELEVLERRNHSMPVTYISLGKDATIAGSQVDFKFRNNTEFPLYIESYLTGNKLYMIIFGKEDRNPNRKIEFESAVIKKIPPPPEKVIEDPTLEVGEREVVRKAQTGYVVKLYKKIYVGNELKDTVLVNDSYYRAVGAEVKIGTKTVETINIPEDETLNEEEEEKDIIEIDEVDIDANDVFDQVDEGVITEDESGESSGNDP